MSEDPLGLTPEQRMMAETVTASQEVLAVIKRNYAHNIEFMRSAPDSKIRLMGVEYTGSQLLEILGEA